MVEKLKKILDILNKNNKAVWLFAFLKIDEFIDKWSLVISAPWVNDSNRNTEFQYMLGIVKENMNPEELSSIGRIVFLSKDDHLIKELLKKKSGDEIKEEKINGNIIHEGQILESNAGLVWQENQTLPLK
ncbi:MAG: hypothetical protein AAB340_00255 [Patescibacteria group bacterium]